MSTTMTTTNAISKKPPLLIVQDTQHKLGVAFSYLERSNYDNDHFVDQRLDFKLLFVHLEMSVLDSTQGLKRVNSRQNNTELIALTFR